MISVLSAEIKKFVSFVQRSITFLFFRCNNMTLHECLMRKTRLYDNMKTTPHPFVMPVNYLTIYQLTNSFLPLSMMILLIFAKRRMGSYNRRDTFALSTAL